MQTTKSPSSVAKRIGKPSSSKGCSSKVPEIFKSEICVTGVSPRASWRPKEKDQHDLVPPLPLAGASQGSIETPWRSRIGCQWTGKTANVSNRCISHPISSKFIQSCGAIIWIQWHFRAAGIPVYLHRIKDRQVQPGASRRSAANSEPLPGGSSCYCTISLSQN